MSDRHQYIEKIKAKLDEWNAEIDLLEAKARQMEAEKKIKYGQQINDLKARRQEMLKKIDEVKQSSSGAWEEVKTSLDQAWQSLKDGMERAKSQFK